MAQGHIRLLSLSRLREKAQNSQFVTTQAWGYWRRKDSENPSFPSLSSCMGSEKNSSQLPHNQHDPPSSRHPHISAYVRTFLRRTVSFFFIFFNLSGAYKIVWVRDKNSYWKVQSEMKSPSVAAPKSAATSGQTLCYSMVSCLNERTLSFTNSWPPSSSDEMEPASSQSA